MPDISIEVNCTCAECSADLDVDTQQPSWHNSNIPILKVSMCQACKDKLQDEINEKDNRITELEARIDEYKQILAKHNIFEEQS